jgi:hypothetical protein
MSNYEGASLYDLMQIDEEMVLSMVKEQLNHYKIRKVNDGKCKTRLHHGKFINNIFLCFFCHLTLLNC